MRKGFCILIFASIFFIISPSYAETIMLHLADAAGSKFHIENSIELATAVEDGVMELFFNEGHIMFNMGLSAEDPPEPPFKAERPAIRIAKTGGAGFLLEVALSSSDMAATLPSSALFQFTDIMSNLVISQGEVVVASIDLQRSTGERDICIFLGREIAMRVLSNW